MAHTPGPWTIGVRGQHATYSINQVYGPEGEGVATVYGLPLNTTLEDLNDNEQTRNGLANARLIAAAPDLLTALEEVLSEYEDYADGWEEGSAAFEIVKDAKAAIAKAKGESK